MSVPVGLWQFILYDLRDNFFLLKREFVDLVCFSDEGFRVQTQEERL